MLSPYILVFFGLLIFAILTGLLIKAFGIKPLIISLIFTGIVVLAAWMLATGLTMLGF